jgi:hypothetical protein
LEISNTSSLTMSDSKSKSEEFKVSESNDLLKEYFTAQLLYQ